MKDVSRDMEGWGGGPGAKITLLKHLLKQYLRNRWAKQRLSKDSGN